MISINNADPARRVAERLEELARISETTEGVTRRYLTPEHKKANALVGSWMKEAGMVVHEDAAGNIRGRFEGTDPSLPAIMLGSHLDSVVRAGAYDGTLGVIAAVEAVARLHEQGKRLRHAVEVIGFADEEGARFGVTYLGSAALAGLWEKSWFDAVDADGITLRQAMLNFGLNPDAVDDARTAPESLCGYIELHIEQGILLEKHDRPLGAVTGINCSRRFHIRIIGRTGHAGTIPMSCRQDPMMGAAAVIASFENIAHRYGDSLYCTVGYITCTPNAANCIPGEIDLRLDVRSSRTEELNEALKAMLEGAENICRARGLIFRCAPFFESRLAECSPELVEQVSEAITAVQGDCPFLSSGAGHDAAEMSLVWPMAMIFLRCRNGVSHCPEEYASPEDLEAGVQALLNILTRY